ncbi:type IV secretory system conjugative DNA transfer family protein [Insolitispirillum peregrinum]|uniref:type IV secretory system conjugative DNA transfer family protein n=1 Tax=Insolitispirillum peregrinum TaxID=80876 RepID=UPI00361F9114
MILRLLLILLPLAAVPVIGWVWSSQFGFDATSRDHWRWVRAYVVDYHQAPPFLLYGLYAEAGLMLALVLIFPLTVNRVRAATKSGKHGSDTLHGSARWAQWSDIRRAGLTGTRGVVVGGVERFGRTRTLRHDGPEHILCFAPTRSGKGVTLVLPTLLQWEHSVLVLDIKGENYAKTAGWRASLGHKILKFDPTSESGGARFNPLAEIRLGTNHEIADAQNVAMMIIDPDGKGLRDFWMQSGFGWLTAGMLHVLYRVKAEEQRTASLRDVSLFLSAPSNAGEPVTDEDGLSVMLRGMIAFDHCLNGDPREAINKLVHTAAQEMLDRAGAERSGVHSSAIVKLALYRDPIVAANIAESDFKLSDLMNGDTAAALYLVVPPSDIDRLRPLLRIIMNLVLTRQTAEMRFDGQKSYRHRLLLMLDEFTSIGKLEIFERALAFMAGYGLKAFIIIQDPAQLQKEYGRENAIMGNCHLRIAYAPNTPEAAEVLSKMTGKTTIVQEKRSTSRKGLQLVGNNSDSLNEVARPLLTPDECMTLPGLHLQGSKVIPGDMLIFPAGFPAIHGRQKLYFQDRTLQQRSQMPVPGCPQ